MQPRQGVRAQAAGHGGRQGATKLFFSFRINGQFEMADSSLSASGQLHHRTRPLPSSEARHDSGTGDFRCAWEGGRSPDLSTWMGRETC